MVTATGLRSTRASLGILSISRRRGANLRWVSTKCFDAAGDDISIALEDGIPAASNGNILVDRAEHSEVRLFPREKRGFIVDGDSKLESARDASPDQVETSARIVGCAKCRLHELDSGNVRRGGLEPVGIRDLPNRNVENLASPKVFRHFYAEQTSKVDIGAIGEWNVGNAADR
jgi:hypothetical protein